VKIFPEKYRLLAWMSLILVAGFMVMAIISYHSSVKALHQTLSQQTLPLIGDNIYSEIQKDIIRPVFVSSLMAHDTFLRDWMLGGEVDPSQIQRYLTELADKYGAVVSFLVSDLSRNYYHQNGILKQVSESEPRDTWYFRVRAMAAPYELNVDPDLANQDTMTIFVNYRVLDYRGRFIGATGVGITVDTLSQLINRYQQRFQRRIYFVDSEGKVVLSGHANGTTAVSLQEQPGIGTIAPDILSATIPCALSYDLDGDTVLVNAREIPELGWYLVVEQSESDELQHIKQAFWLDIAICILVTASVLLLVWYTVNRYHRRLEQLVTIDHLTGCLNRRTFELMLRYAINNTRRSAQPLSLLLCDIDYFKQINDQQGHAAGDAVLRQLGRLIRAALRQNDVIARWGGEEFLLLLPGTSLSDAVGVAEKLRQRIAAHDFRVAGRLQSITVSVGVAQHDDGEDANTLFDRADRALYQAKDNGRNRVTQEPPAAGQSTAASSGV